MNLLYVSVTKKLKYFLRKILVKIVKLGLIKPIDAKISYICEKQEWAIFWEGKFIENEINLLLKEKNVVVTHKVFLVTSPIIHFGSQYMWEIWRDLIAPNSKVIVNFFHGKHDDGVSSAKHIDDFILNHKRIDVIVVPNSIVYERLLSWGIPKSKIQLIFIGVDSKMFTKQVKQSKFSARKQLGIPQDAFVIGSFQKDGIGWKSGHKPKYVKGPDILADVIEILSRTRKVSLLLTGPSRGYLLSRLRKLGISYKYFRVEDYSTIPIYYQALDLYLITSREEGGPKGLVESIASSIPVASTQVGMAVDLLNRSQIFSSFDPTRIAVELNEMIETNKFLTPTENENEVINSIDYKEIARKYYDVVYSKLMNI
jgi:glycosyltransferase involved in cell wall biosynthesis